MSSRVSTLISLLAFIASLVFAAVANGQPQPAAFEPFSVRASSRLAANIEDSGFVLLPGNRPPLALPEFETGPVAPDFAIQRMVLVLRPSPAQQSALDALLQAQRDPKSSYYHQWLTPALFAEHFGASAEDTQRIANWLQSRGFQVDEIAASARSITFSGTAAQVERAFSTSMRSYFVNGVAHVANAIDPSIPDALTPVVAGVLSLHNFPLRAMHTALRIPASRTPSPENTMGASHFVTPGDLAVIYNVNPLYTQGLDGSGQSVAVVARSNIHLSDVETFRSIFGLPANNPQVIVNGSDPGTANSDELTEATLDVEYAGALARKAAVKFVTTASTAASDGVFLSAQYIVNQNLSPVMTMSFGLCEASMGTAQNTYISALWQQAAAQGITVLVSSGDSGAAGCDTPSSTTALSGAAVNGLCSTPYATCVGGTEFNDASNPSQYWAASSAAGTGLSALSYIPEVVWNESSTSAGLWASGGGASKLYSKPAWQVGNGVPADGKRDVPDLSLTAAGHDGYIMVMSGQEYAVSGTSASTPTMAGIFALIGQTTGVRQGLANPVLYSLASRQNGGGAAVFHDITGGNNSVPGLSGFSATTGYDRATGLGSVDASSLVLHWNDGQSTPALQTALSSSALSLSAPSVASITVKVSVTGALTSSVLLSASGMPAGMAAVFTPPTIAVPGSGNTTMQLTVASTVAPGTYNIAVTAVSGSLVASANVTVTVLAPTFALAESTTTVTMAAGSSHAITLTTVATGALNSGVTLTVTGVPAGVSATFRPATIIAPGSGSSVLTLTAASSVTPGSYVLLITGTAGAVSTRVQCVLNVPSLTATLNIPSISLARGSSESVIFTTRSAGGFNSAVNFSVTGLPSGVSAALTPATIASPGAGVVAIKFTASNSATLGGSKVSIIASGGGLTASLPLTLTVTPAPAFTLTAGTSSAVVRSSGSTVIQLFTAAQDGFAAPLTVSASGAPVGVSMVLSSGIVAPGQFLSLTIIAGAKALPRSATVTVTATGGGLTRSATIPLSVTQ